MNASLLDLLHLESNDDQMWAGIIPLSAWNEFQIRPTTSDESAEEVISLYVNRETDQTAPSLQQTEAYHFLMSHQEQIRDSILERLLTDYDQMSETYEYEPEEAAKWMPPVESRSDFEPLISLLAVVIHQVHKDGMAYIGFEFECTWDDEHGVGVMMHRQRIVKIGGADSAVLSWIATQDSKGENK